MVESRFHFIYLLNMRRVWISFCNRLFLALYRLSCFIQVLLMGRIPSMGKFYSQNGIVLMGCTAFAFRQMELPRNRPSNLVHAMHIEMGQW
jgi:hypothetical protein